MKRNQPGALRFPGYFYAFLEREMVKAYRNQRNLLNQQLKMYEGDGEFDIPIVPAYYGEIPEKWIGFNYALNCKDPENTGVHFFLDDYQFERIWANPNKYLNMFRRFKAVIQPDFSLYRDYPKALQVYNSFRNCWLANYLIDHGINVIPHPSFSDADSHDWSFANYEPGGIVAISTVGVRYDKETFLYFAYGYETMLRRLKPDTILIHGEVPSICRGNIIHIPSFQSRLHEMDGRYEKKSNQAI